jgi:hypothetical protein
MMDLSMRKLLAQMALFCSAGLGLGAFLGSIRRLCQEDRVGGIFWLAFAVLVVPAGIVSAFLIQRNKE